MPQNKLQELEHARKILHNSEFYWNSETTAGEKGSLRRAEWIKTKAGLAPGKEVLEIGCGTGFFSQIFIKAGVTLHAVDISPELLAKAIERCGDRADFRVCDVEALPFDSGFFDAIVGVRVLHHLDMEASFKEIVRTLKKGGVVAFCEPNMLNPQIMIQKNIPFIKRLMGDTPDETAFFRWRLKHFLESKCFRDIFIEPYDFLHPWIPGFMVKPLEKVGGVLERTPIIRQIAGSLFIFARKS